MFKKKRQRRQERKHALVYIYLDQLIYNSQTVYTTHTKLFLYQAKPTISLENYFTMMVRASCTFIKNSQEFEISHKVVTLGVQTDGSFVNSTTRHIRISFECDYLQWLLCTGDFWMFWNLNWNLASTIIEEIAGFFLIATWSLSCRTLSDETKLGL